MLNSTPQRWRQIRIKVAAGFGLVILTATLLLATAFTYVIHQLEVDNATRTLDTALKAAWALFNQRPGQIQGILQEASRSRSLQAALRESQTQPLSQALNDWKVSYPFVDFWLITDKEGRVLSRSDSTLRGDRWVFENLVSLAQRDTGTLISTELMPYEALAMEGLSLAAKAEVNLVPNGSDHDQLPTKFRDGLVTLILSPVIGTDGQVLGVLVGGLLLNHDQWISTQYTNSIPHTYLSIGVKGIRIASNIQTLALSRPLGSLQEVALIDTTESGKPYRGRMTVNEKPALIAVDPIFNQEGKAVGNLGVGAPINTFTVYRGQSIQMILVACLIVFAIAMALAEWVGGIIVNPIVHLKHMTLAVAGNEADPDEMEWHEPRAPQEVEELAETIIAMAKALRQKEHEAQTYAAALTEEKAQLEANIRERTRELATTVAQLRLTNQYKSQFLANMSHELRTPLNSIIGFARLLRDQIAGAMNGKQLRYTDNILAGGHHLLDLIDDILDLVKIEQGKENFSPEFVSPQEAVEAITLLLGHQAKDQELTMTVNVEPGLPEALWDKKRVKQILSNLVSNAIKFTPKGGEVTIEARRDGGAILFRVTDTGIGIRPEDRERVFLAFEQAESSYTRQFEGTGLGLAISKQLVELHHGTIWLDSTPGVGTTVYFRLPITPFGPDERSGC